MGRNVARCRVVSRRDNNDMWYMAEQLGSIANRIATGYKGVRLGDDGNYRKE